MAKTTKKSNSHLRAYKTYRFMDKDPVIDIVRTMVDDARASYKTIRDNSGVSTTTLRGWFYGKTRRPQFATVQAVAHSLGRSFIAEPVTARVRKGKTKRTKAQPSPAPN